MTTNEQMFQETIAQALWDAQEMRKKYEAQEKILKDQLKTLAAGKTSHFGSFLFALKERKGSINYAQVPQLMGVDLEPYRSSPVPVWELIKLS